LLVGLIAGWLAGQIVKGTGFGLVADTFASASSALLSVIGYCPDWGSILASLSWPPSSRRLSAPFSFWSFSGSSTDEADGEFAPRAADHLSFAGAAIEFRRALLVNPYDAESVAGAIAQALAMSLEERRARHHALLAAIPE
jgi:hypothetical protein